MPFSTERKVIRGKGSQSKDGKDKEGIVEKISSYFKASATKK